jgi:hypothetical protein
VGHRRDPDSAFKDGVSPQKLNNYTVNRPLLPHTYAHKGRQFVTVASGLGGTLARRAIGGAVPTGGSLWTFAITPE